MKHSTEYVIKMFSIDLSPHTIGKSSVFRVSITLVKTQKIKQRRKKNSSVIRFTEQNMII